jgi:hypothetical protein
MHVAFVIKYLLHAPSPSLFAALFAQTISHNFVSLACYKRSADLVTHFDTQSVMIVLCTQRTDPFHP